MHRDWLRLLSFYIVHIYIFTYYRSRILIWVNDLWQASKRNHGLCRSIFLFMWFCKREKEEAKLPCTPLESFSINNNTSLSYIVVPPLISMEPQHILLHQERNFHTQIHIPRNQKKSKKNCEASKISSSPSHTIWYQRRVATHCHLQPCPLAHGCSIHRQSRLVISIFLPILPFSYTPTPYPYLLGLLLFI